MKETLEYIVNLCGFREPTKGQLVTLMSYLQKNTFRYSDQDIRKAFEAHSEGVLQIDRPLTTLSVKEFNKVMHAYRNFLQPSKGSSYEIPEKTEAQKEEIKLLFIDSLNNEYLKLCQKKSFTIWSPVYTHDWFVEHSVMTGKEHLSPKIQEKAKVQLKAFKVNNDASHHNRTFIKNIASQFDKKEGTEYGNICKSVALHEKLYELAMEGKDLKALLHKELLEA